MSRINKLGLKEYRIRSEKVHFQTQTDDLFYNTVAGVDKQISTVVGGAKEEGCIVALTAGQAGQLAPTLLTNTGIVPGSGSVTGMTILTSDTFHLTKKGLYFFRVSCLMGATAPPYVVQLQCLLDGLVADTISLDFSQKENSNEIYANFHTDTRLLVDGTVDVTFKAGVDNVPTGGARPTFSGTIVINYLRVT